MPQILTNKRAVLIIAHEGFQDLEYSRTREALEKGGVEITVSSSQKGPAKGKDGRRVEVDKVIKDLDVKDVDAIIFIGGPGAMEYVDSSVAHEIARKAVEYEKVLAAICIAPEILARAGLHKGIHATVWASLLDRSPIGVLEDGGAIYEDKPVVIDGKIVTGNGPGAAQEFGEKIVELLK